MPAYCLASVRQTVRARNVVWQWVRRHLVGKSRPKTVWPSVAPRRLSVLVSGKPRQGKDLPVSPIHQPLRQLSSRATGQRRSMTLTLTLSGASTSIGTSHIWPSLTKFLLLCRHVYKQAAFVVVSLFAVVVQFASWFVVVRRRRLNSIRTHLLAHLPFMCIHYLPPKECHCASALAK